MYVRRVTRGRFYPLLLISAAGLALRLFLAFHWYGSGDLFTFEIVASRTLDDPLHSYAGNVAGGRDPVPVPAGLSCSG